MSAFIETTIYEWDALVNVDAIEMVSPDFNGGETSVIRWRRPYEQTSPEGGSVLDIHTLEYNEDEAQEPYDSLKAKILAATAKEEKGKIPHTPLKEKGETSLETKTRARTREKFVKPTVEAVAKYIRDNGYTFDPEAFWNFYESKGWRVGNHVMKSWTSACVTWQKRTDAEKKRETARQAHVDAKMDEREAKRTAHIDAILEEREAKRERRTGGGRKKADNYIASTPEQVKEFTDGL